MNAPWVRQCDCSEWSDWQITWNDNNTGSKPWWHDYKVTCATDNVINNPNIYTTAQNDIVGGSDYPDGHGGYKNTPASSVTNKTDVPFTYTNYQYNMRNH